MGELFTGNMIFVLAFFTILAVLGILFVQRAGIQSKRRRLHETGEEAPRRQSDINYLDPKQRETREEEAGRDARVTVHPRREGPESAP